MEPQAIADKLISLQRAYAFTYRAMVTEERYTGLVESGILKDYAINMTALREPLIEHVGHLPIIASFLHSLIEHRNEVDLGRALIMLSIHDIGETVVGDQFAYTKTDAHAVSEEAAAKLLLSEELFAYYTEMEQRESLDAKFAKSIDAMAPFLHEMSRPELTSKRFAFYQFNTEKIRTKKRPYFEWDAVLLALFDEFMERFWQIEKDAGI